LVGHHRGGDLIVVTAARDSVAFPHELGALIAVKSVVLRIRHMSSCSSSENSSLYCTYSVVSDNVVDELETVHGSKRLNAEAHVVRHVIALEHRVECVAVDSATNYSLATCAYLESRHSVPQTVSIGIGVGRSRINGLCVRQHVFVKVIRVNSTCLALSKKHLAFHE
jgi:hypothetical protein